MSIRSIILAAAVPLFILLAAVNGALFYYQSRSEMLHGLDQRALAAAVSGAEYIAEMPHPEDLLDNVQRRRSLQSALGEVADLDAYYWINVKGRAEPLAPPVRAWTPGTAVAAPDAPTLLPLTRDASGRRYVAAAAPAGERGYVAARLDAEPLFSRLDEMLRWILWGVLLAALVGLLTGSYVARRIQRELALARETIRALDGGEAMPHMRDLSITEAVDLASALRLVDANRQAAQTWLRQQIAREDGRRSDEDALRLLRDEAFPPVAATLAGTRLAVRIIGHAPLGSFYALCEGEAKSALVIGQCAGAGGFAALAAAMAARRLIEAQWRACGLRLAVEQAAQAFAIPHVEYLEWDANSQLPRTRLMAITDPETRRRAAIFAQADPEMAPEKILDGTAALLQAEGVFASLR